MSSQFIFKTRIHSSRMRTARCIGLSLLSCIAPNPPCTPPCHTCPKPHMHLLAMHAPQTPATPAAPVTHALAPHPCGQTDTHENITFAHFICRTVKKLKKETKCETERLIGSVTRIWESRVYCLHQFTVSKSPYLWNWQQKQGWHGNRIGWHGNRIGWHDNCYFVVT